jgi:hypothetical protein
MILTVGELKKYLQDVPDNIVFGTMGFAKNAEIEIYTPKRFLYIKSTKKGVSDKLVLNSMGTHWNEHWAKENDGEYAGYVDQSDYKLHLK